ncbi:MAG: mannose-1-phosphate guanylyltransferase/mannose-6-phosphate isomerase, partial [Thiothrix sp.]|nr:mannose-1-phosphate guanylyltransferase/mannose-6-phosphate isomerase [Thiothrix sp.]
MTTITPVILSGGSGTRLWPLSRQLRPKQFLPLVNEHTLFQNTVQRLQGIPQLADVLVVCNEEHRFMAAEQLRELGIRHQGILLEPIGRNTAPAIALAALHLTQQGQAEALMLVLPADHVLRDEVAFQQAVAQAAQAATDGYLVTFGIVPQCAETGYGYIRQGESLTGLAAQRVAAFVEKPDHATATTYLESGEYLWNSGMFLFRADQMLAALAQFQPKVLADCRAALAHPSTDIDFVRLDKTAFTACPSISIDYAVMEKTADAVVVALDAGWNDVGAWSAVWDVSPQDTAGNVLRGDTLTHEAYNNLVYSDSRLVALVGVDDLVVVET